MWIFTRPFSHNKSEIVSKAPKSFCDFYWLKIKKNKNKKIGHKKLVYYRCWFRNTNKKGSSRKSKFKCLFVILTFTLEFQRFFIIAKKIWLLLLFIFNIKLCLWCVDRPLKRILIKSHKFSFLCHKTNRKIFNKFSNVNISVFKIFVGLFFYSRKKEKIESSATRRFKDFHNFKVSSRIYFTTIIICGSYFPSFLFCFLSLFWL